MKVTLYSDAKGPSYLYFCGKNSNDPFINTQPIKLSKSFLLSFNKLSKRSIV